jgi:hypothetical protein
MWLFQTAAAAAVGCSVLAVPVVAQQGRTDTPAPSAPAATSQSGQMSDAMVQKVGAALRHVATIRQTYQQRAQSANTQQQVQDLNDQARKEMVKAISDQGLSVQQYQQAIQMAQADPALKQRVISAAQQSE